MYYFKMSDNIWPTSQFIIWKYLFQDFLVDWEGKSFSIYILLIKVSDQFVSCNSVQNINFVCFVFFSLKNTIFNENCIYFWSDYIENRYNLQLDHSAPYWLNLILKVSLDLYDCVNIEVKYLYLFNFTQRLV